MTQVKHVHIESYYDSWYIEVRNPEMDRVYKTFSWDHNATEDGIGGEKIIAKLLKYLGHSVEVEDVC